MEQNVSFFVEERNLKCDVLPTFLVIYGLRLCEMEDLILVNSNKSFWIVEFIDLEIMGFKFICSFGIHQVFLLKR